MKKTLIYFIFAIFVVSLFFYGLICLYPEYTFSKIIELERKKAGLKIYTIDVKGLKTVYLQGGKGENLLLLHGFGADKDNWTMVSKYLVEHFLVTAPDLIGFGESDKPLDEEYSIEAQMERVIEFADKTGMEKFHLGGSSMGGCIASAIAAKIPERIKSLWLLAPAGVYSSKESEMYSLIKKGKNPLIPHDLESFEYLVDFVFYNKPFIPTPIMKVLAKKAVSNRNINELVFKTLVDNPFHSDKALKGSKIPVLIIWGRNDRVLHWTGADVLDRVMEKSNSVILEKTGHVPMIEKPEISANLFIKFQNILMEK